MKEYFLKELTEVEKITVLKILIQLRDNAYFSAVSRYAGHTVAPNNFSKSGEWILKDNCAYITKRDDFDKIMLDLLLSVGYREDDKEYTNEVNALLTFVQDDNKVSLRASKNNYKANVLLEAICDVLANVYFSEIDLIIDEKDEALKKTFKETQGKPTLAYYIFNKMGG